MDWDPSKQFDPEDTLPIHEPPCKKCVHWKPRRPFDSEAKYTGVRCCQAEEMKPDFSCYKLQQTTRGAEPSSAKQGERGAQPPSTRER